MNQSTGTAAISSSFGGDNYYQSSTTSATATVLTPTTLTVSAGTSDFADAGTVSAVLTNSITGAVIPGESVTLTLGTQSCTAKTNTSGMASCSITPNEPAATYTLSGSFAGDTTKAPQLLASTGSNHYVVTLEETAIAYTGPSIAVSGMSFTMSAHLTTDGNPLGGRAVLMTLGSGTTAQSCTGTTNAIGERQLHDRPCEPDRGDGAHRGHLRRGRLLPSGQRLGQRDHGVAHRRVAGSSSATSRRGRRPTAPR